MKTLYDIYEGIFDNDYEEKLNNRLIANNLLRGSGQVREKAIQDLLNLLKSHNAKQHKTTAKMKNSDSYFVEFIYLIKVENGEATQSLDQISCILICKKIDEKYINIHIDVDEGRSGGVFRLSWRHTQAYFNPKSSNTKLYEVPEELIGLFQIIHGECMNEDPK